MKSRFTESDPSIIEIGLDESGRGPLFGRVYASAVVLPLSGFDTSVVKDSKKFKSQKKINNVADYVKSNALAWSVRYEDEKTIDTYNILRATQMAMHACVRDIIASLELRNEDDDMDKLLLLIDGNIFYRMSRLNKRTKTISVIPYKTIVRGDSEFASIAAASILAKTARDAYIAELCNQDPTLHTRYDLLKNKGYGTKKHVAGILQYGITERHRTSFAPCRGSVSVCALHDDDMPEEDDDGIVAPPTTTTSTTTMHAM